MNHLPVGYNDTNDLVVKPLNMFLLGRKCVFGFSQKLTNIAFILFILSVWTAIQTGEVIVKTFIMRTPPLFVH